METFSKFQPEVLSIPYSALEDLLEFYSRKLVGKALKRCEICSNPDILKAQLRELIYEQTRDLQDLIVALNYGMCVSEFNFRSKEKDSKEKSNGK